MRVPSESSSLAKTSVTEQITSANVIIGSPYSKTFYCVFVIIHLY